MSLPPVYSVPIAFGQVGVGGELVVGPPPAGFAYILTDIQAGMFGFLICKGRLIDSLGNTLVAFSAPCDPLDGSGTAQWQGRIVMNPSDLFHCVCEPPGDSINFWVSGYKLSLP